MATRKGSGRAGPVWAEVMAGAMESDANRTMQLSRRAKQTPNRCIFYVGLLARNFTPGSALSDSGETPLKFIA
jgi:hypothetical protein